MPATEQTWRNTKFMHIVFGGTSLLMLVCTLWMLAADHNREWKDYQRKFRDVETWTANSRIDEQNTADFENQSAEKKMAFEETLKVAPDPGLVDEFVEEAKKREKQYGNKVARIDTAEKAAVKASNDEMPAARREVISAMDTVLRIAKQDEENLTVDLKAKRADLDVVKSVYDLSIGKGYSADADEKAKKLKDEEKLQEKIYSVEKEVNSLNVQVEEAKTHRLKLQELIVKINTKQDTALKAYEDHRATLVQLEKAREDREVNFWKRALALPIIDAFGRPLKIEQIWLPNLTLNNNFKDVARFDRCTTCHQAIDRTAPGSAVTPGYDTRKTMMVELATPAEAPKPPENVTDKQAIIKHQLKEAYGIELSQRGLFAADDVTIEVVWPKTAGAKAGLLAGDIILNIGTPDPIDPGAQVKIVDKQRAVKYLLESVNWSKPLTLEISRGMPNPYSSHPRLDLFVGSLSPHKMNDVGCTICHDGQGSATAFQWASHTPNTPNEADKWKKEHGWFNNHHWIFPMHPTRFAESSCLKCHHDVTELEPSDRFPDPPAPKVTKGHDLIRQYGCFGCHEINGYDGPNKRRGPDMRAEPMYFAAAAQLLIDPGLDSEQKKLAREVIAHPELDGPRKLLAESIRADAAHSGDKDNPAKLDATSHKLASLIGADDATPGQLRKVGPSLRHVASKVDKAFLYDWINNPMHFRPTTKMPRFFGLFDHLVPELNDQLKMTESRGKAEAEKFEPVEIRAVAEYLLSASQPFTYAKLSDPKAEKASAERGKFLFETRGCLACHQHADFPNAHDKQGPNLTGLGGKLVSSKGQDWLYSWVREPNRYHTRTVMPNLFLEPIKGPDGTTTDPAADITAYLLQSKSAEKDGAPYEPVKMPEVDTKALDELVMTYLRAIYTEEKSKDYLTTGIPEDRRAGLKGDEVLLVGVNPLTAEKKLQYVGRRTISRLGCAGCHDIPGYEDSKPIGTGLADWGRKETSKLAFEQIIEYLTETNGGQHSHAHGAHGDAHGGDATAAASADHGSEHHGLNPRELDKTPGLEDSGYYFQALLNHEREGFIWQKIRQPRSYDFKKTENKKYTDRLRMPQFNLTASEREAIITFVLGLVAEPPAAKYVYKASPRRQAELNGQNLLTKFNCTGCHTTKMGSWTFNYDPANPPTPGEVVDYPFLSPHFTPQQIEDSKKVDRRGLGVATVSGMKSPEDLEDDNEKPIYVVTPWMPTVIDGKVWWPGKQAVPVPSVRLEGPPQAPLGGEFARMLQPLAFVEGKKLVANALPDNAWGWVPPPLVGEGKKVQTGWLHDFLLEPYRIRPAVMLRMPKFNMSSAEASQFANYFAAVDGADFPYEFKPRMATESLASESSPERERLDLALKVITSNTYCVQCHKVGDFVPNQPSFGMAPNLAEVQHRLRPEFMREWIASPKTKLPYTTMPDNIPFKNKSPEQTEVQKILGGDPAGQVQTIVDFLLNYDRYMEGKTLIKPLVKPAPTAPPAAAATGGK